MRIPRILISAQSSGCGKTSIVCGLLQALSDRGLKVSSFKCGPDYIDPMFHSKVIGTVSGNLDPFFADDATLGSLFAEGADGSDISVIEGAMGFYDGSDLGTTKDSSCDASLKLDAPVVLIVDASGSSLSSLAVLKGFLEFEANVIKGVIFNRMSSRVFQSVRRRAEEMGVEVIGHVPRLPEDLVLESRHLGLVMPSEIDGIREKIRSLAEVLEETLDIDRLIAIADRAPDIEYEPPVLPEFHEHVRIALADDEAFCFTYRENISLLQRFGAEVIPFSPLNDAELPDADAVLFPGGYPELFAERLSTNRGMIESVRRRIGEGMLCIAECGGFMYLHESMEGADGSMHPMCGMIKGESRNAGRLVRFGYVSLSPKGFDGIVKGHEFHHWDSTDNGDDWVAVNKFGESYGCIHDHDGMIAGFPHLYYHSNPEFAVYLIRRIADSRRVR